MPARSRSRRSPLLYMALGGTFVVCTLLACVVFALGDDTDPSTAAAPSPTATRAARAATATSKPKATPAPTNTPSPAQETEADGSIQDVGDVIVEYPNVSTKQNRAYRTELQESQLLESLADGLNDTFALPRDLLIQFDECGEDQAYYDPETTTITMCYEMIDGLYDALEPYAKTDAQLDTMVSNSILFTFWHELGHALIDIYDLPITGREEDAVDQLSIYMLADGTKEGEQAAIDGATSFAGYADQSNTDDLVFWDEHSLDRQRYYNLLCWAYGENPDGLGYLIKQKKLPKDRAEQCPAEYEQIDQAWSTLLAPYVKE